MRNFVKKLSYLTGAVLATVVCNPAHSVPLDYTINPDKYMNAPNGVAGLNSTGAVTAPVNTKTVTSPIYNTSSIPYTSLPTKGMVDAQRMYCSDCYSKLREAGDKSTGIIVIWHAADSSWRDGMGLLVQH